MEEAERFASTVIERLSTMADPVVVRRSVDPEDGTGRIEIHVFGVPKAVRRDVETIARSAACEAEDAIDIVSSIAFVHDDSLPTAALEAISAGAIMRLSGGGRT